MMSGFYVSFLYVHMIQVKWWEDAKWWELCDLEVWGKSDDVEAIYVQTGADRGCVQLFVSSVLSCCVSAQSVWERPK